MKFLIHSNAPTQPTGYGVQTRHLADLLAAAGHDVAVSCTYGHQGQIGTWKSPSGHDVRLYPSGYITSSGDVLYAHAQHWFEGDRDAGWIIVLSDVWSLADPRWGLKDWNIIAWAPVDHLPVPPGVLSFFEITGAIPLAMSQFGREMFAQVGLTPAYAPLAVDTEVFKPTYTIDTEQGQVSARELFGIPHDAFVVGMVAMNKDPYDRKGFNEALRAFGRFWQDHQRAVLFLHTDPFGMAGGLALKKLAIHAAVPEHAIVYSDPYAYRLGLPPKMMAAAYTAMDVLLAPSRGEGFCVPLIEAQACGVPVIASNFSAQPELIGAGWKVDGQLEWDPSQEASYFRAYIPSVLARLEDAYAADLDAMQRQAREFAQRYDVRTVFEDYWRPFLATLLPPEVEPKPKMETVDVLVPCLRSRNAARLMRSFEGFNVIVGELDTPTRTYAENVNALVERSEADWVLIVGDDTEALPGWFEAAQEISDRFDVIGTNDSEPGRVRNPDVAAGRHADHFLIRRSYIDDEGASLDGPGVAMPTAYRHWYTDREVVELAKARGVFGFAPECRIVHHHPGYDGDEKARESDPVYMAAVDSSDQDYRTWMKRAPLIEAHRITRAPSVVHSSYGVRP